MASFPGAGRDHLGNKAQPGKLLKKRTNDGAPPTAVKSEGLQVGPSPDTVFVKTSISDSSVQAELGAADQDGRKGQC